MRTFASSLLSMSSNVVVSDILPFLVTSRDNQTGYILFDGVSAALSAFDHCVSGRQAVRTDRKAKRIRGTATNSLEAGAKKTSAHSVKPLLPESCICDSQIGQNPFGRVLFWLKCAALDY